jgi:hypothetical protein
MHVNGICSTYSAYGMHVHQPFLPCRLHDAAKQSQASNSHNIACHGTSSTHFISRDTKAVAGLTGFPLQSLPTCTMPQACGLVLMTQACISHGSMGQHQTYHRLVVLGFWHIRFWDIRKHTHPLSRASARSDFITTGDLTSGDLTSGDLGFVLR